MPQRDGKGPNGQGPGSGRGKGPCKGGLKDGQGQDSGQGKRGRVGENLRPGMKREVNGTGRTQRQK